MKLKSPSELRARVLPRDSAHPHIPPVAAEISGELVAVPDSQGRCSHHLSYSNMKSDAFGGSKATETSALCKAGREKNGSEKLIFSERELIGQVCGHLPLNWTAKCWRWTHW